MPTKKLSRSLCGPSECHGNMQTIHKKLSLPPRVSRVSLQSKYDSSYRNIRGNQHGTNKMGNPSNGQYEQIETLHPADDLVVGNRSPSLLHSLSEPEFESE